MVLAEEPEVVGEPTEGTLPVDVGAFPREELTRGEELLFEARPSRVPFLLHGGFPILLTLIVFIGFTIPTALSGQLQTGQSVFCEMILGVMAILSLAFLLSYLKRWQCTTYALTNIRVLARFGWLSHEVMSCPHLRIENVSVLQSAFDNFAGYGTILFATAGFTAYHADDVKDRVIDGLNVSGRRMSVGALMLGAVRSVTVGPGKRAASPGVVWIAVLEPMDVRRRMMGAIEESQKQQAREGYLQMARALR